MDGDFKAVPSADFGIELRLRIDFEIESRLGMDFEPDPEAADFGAEL